MRIYLVGYMGSGKTTIGKRLAKELGYDFIDLDKYIEQKSKQSISTFFKEKGEAAFRKEERKRLVEISSRKNTVVSVGGGTPCFSDNMEYMNQQGVTIFLDIPLSCLVQRLRTGKRHRPLLADKDHTELALFVESNLNERLPFYSQAKYRIHAANIKHTDLLPFF